MNPPGLGAVLDWVPSMVTRYRATTDADYPDLVQEARVAAWRAWGQADTTLAPRDYWARQAATRRTQSLAARRTRWLSATPAPSGALQSHLVPVGDDMPDTPTPSNPHAATLDRVLLGDWTRPLTPRQAEVVYRKMWLDETSRQVADQMGVSASWVDRAWLGARNALAATYGGEVKKYVPNRKLTQTEAAV